MAEAARYGVLKTCQRNGIISNLRLQVPYELHAANGKTICKYIADFVYTEHGKEVVEDVKGMKTPVYNLKKKWMKAEYGISILETGLKGKR